MPYIEQDKRFWVEEKVFNPTLTTLKNMPRGELNYIITTLLLMTEPKCYDDYNSLIGVLECAKLELYRRKIAIYEEEKIIENGDVY